MPESNQQSKQEQRRIILEASKELHDILREVTVPINQVLCKLAELESQLLPQAVEERFAEEGSDKKKRTVTCSNCGKVGHTMRTCGRRDRDE